MIKDTLGKVWDFYFNNYKKMSIIPLALLIVMVAAIFYTHLTIGDFFQKDVSLKGGYTYQISTNATINVNDLASKLTFMQSPDIQVIKNALQTQVQGYEITTETNVTTEKVVEFFNSNYDLNLTENSIALAFQSPTIASSFFAQATKAVILAFVLMGAVVFYYFRKPAPSLSIILSTLMDVICVIGVMDVLGLKMSTAAIGSILMIIGYSTDSDVLMSTNILLRRDKPLRDRMLRAFKTEITMDIAAAVVFTVMLVLSNVSMIKEIALILLLGVWFDVINTWLGTATIQRMMMVKEDE